MNKIAVRKITLLLPMVVGTFGTGWHTPQSSGAESVNVAVLVEEVLYASGEISLGLNQYLANLATEGYHPILETGFHTSDAPADVRSFLADQYNTLGLTGAVFIGHLPIQNVYTSAGGGIGGEFHPCDLYYTDLDGSWTSTGAHGFLPDTHSDGNGDLGPEIWLGWLPSWGLVNLHAGRTEASLLNDYFTKNHAYRGGQLNSPATGLAYTDDDWNPELRVAALDLAVTGAVNNVWNDPDIPGDQTTAANYEWRLGNESYEHVLLSSHSDSTAHSMSGSVSSSELQALNPQNLFYHLFACSSARFTDYNCIGAEYVLGAGKGLAVVGPTKTGGMMSDTMDDYFGPLGLGFTFGDAMLNWWNSAIDPNGHTEVERAWYYGMTIIGDPTLVTQAYVPEPTAFSLFLCGMILASIPAFCSKYLD